MTEKTNRIMILQELLECSNNLYTWRFNRDMELENTNCPDASFFESTLQLSGCSNQIHSYFTDNDIPLLLSDALGLVWLADCEKYENTIHEFHVIGPAFTSDFSDKNLENQLSKINLSFSTKHDFIERLRNVPVILFTSFARYGIMLHYCLTGKKIMSKDISIAQPTIFKRDDKFDSWKNDEVHGTMFYEQQMLKLVTEGDLNFREKLDAIQLNGKPGLMCPGDPLRQAKDEIIILIALCERAAIQGGLSLETAFTIGDYYIQMVEAAHVISEVHLYGAEMMQDMVQRVHSIKQYAQCSSLTRQCIEYISRNINERIDLEQMASEIGYAKYYLTSKFKDEIGINIRDYISQQKIEHAKLLLQSTPLSVSEIGTQLGFSDSSYFSAVFKKWAGIQPKEYRERQPIE